MCSDLIWCEPYEPALADSLPFYILFYALLIYGLLTR